MTSILEKYIRQCYDILDSEITYCMLRRNKIVAADKNRRIIKISNRQKHLEINISCFVCVPLVCAVAKIIFFVDSVLYIYTHTCF